MKQHTTPCDKCPFRRTAIPGWLGGLNADQFRRVAAADVIMNCHTRAGVEGISYADPDPLKPQCAGRAIYWANQLKIPRRADILVLPPNKALVFTWPTEFLKHHGD